MSDQPDNEETAAPGSPEPGGEGVGEALRAAVERTLAVTADSATGTRQRAQELVDDVVRRGQVARDEVTRRGEEATSRLAEAINELRRADAAGLEKLGERLDAMEARLTALEADPKPGSHQSNPEVEAKSMPPEPHGQRDSVD